MHYGNDPCSSYLLFVHHDFAEDADIPNPIKQNTNKLATTFETVHNPMQMQNLCLLSGVAVVAGILQLRGAVCISMVELVLEVEATMVTSVSKFCSM